MDRRRRAKRYLRSDHRTVNSTTPNVIMMYVILIWTKKNLSDLRLAVKNGKPARFQDSEEAISYAEKKYRKSNYKVLNVEYSEKLW